jgi:hypothetical protein
MRLVKNGRAITCLTDWQEVAPPKGDIQWVEGRSAYELARAWCGTHGPVVPEDLRTLFESSEITRGLGIDVAYPERHIIFDGNGGEPRNADLAFAGHAGDSKVAVTVEAKADEPFGTTVADTMSAALERSLRDSRSHGVRRVEELARSLFTPRREGQREIGDLRYQLLTAAAGTLAYAIAEEAAAAVLIVHEFVTDRTREHLRQRNAEDYRAFLGRLGGKGGVDAGPSALAGPFWVPGMPLFDRAPALYVGKVVTDCRVASVCEAPAMA